MTRPPNPVPPEIGRIPVAKAIGTPMGAVTRSAGRTHSAVSVATGRNSTPYATSEPSKSSPSRQASRNSTPVQNRPLPSPVRRGFGIRRRERTSGERRRARTSGGAVLRGRGAARYTVPGSTARPCEGSGAVRRGLAAAGGFGSV
jgi:hypothetical protein